ncbi:MAG: RluA family pseudouridine synthase [Bacteroidaceae bacterium]|nr:RluA family pseudouridine synthase [Bacteroidaceae bacterium]
MPSKASHNHQAIKAEYTAATLHPLIPEGEVALPQHFTYPFLYTPHPLAIQAATELKAYLATQTEWQAEISRGKMFGVLVVSSTASVLGGSAAEASPLFFLAAFSGLLDGKNSQQGFVPPIFDLQQPGQYFQQEDAEISQMPDSEAKSLRSRNLQLWLFNQYAVLNQEGTSRTLTDIFDHETCRIPPSGAGECCAPKLLQYAYSHNLRPLCMAEFWMGASPHGQLRYDGDYYPACQAKCKPILRHMLQGLDVEENPLLPMLRQRAKQMRIIYDDPYIVAVDKPAGMLAVRGNIDAPSVESEIERICEDSQHASSTLSLGGVRGGKNRFVTPQSPLEGMRGDKKWAHGVFPVHRLDMDTSGIMLIAKSQEIHRELQVQFYRHIIKKRYVALLDGIVDEDSGTIDLPLSPNALDRPRQMVNLQHGKPAITRYEVISRTDDGHTLVAFYPETGRTHQLRVHAASPEGLRCPIVGDRLYSPGGMAQQNSMQSTMQLPATHMMLHAQSIEFIHPHTGETITLTSPLPAYFEQQNKKTTL